jgi:tripartite-type tricarboxylate transporter receptor subunit TctC
VNAEVVKAVREPAFGEQLKNLGIEIAGTTRAELDAFRADQTRRTIDLVKASGVDVK